MRRTEPRNQVVLTDAHRDLVIDPSAVRFYTVPHVSSGSALSTKVIRIDPIRFPEGPELSCWTSCLSRLCLTNVPLVPRTLYCS